MRPRTRARAVAACLGAILATMCASTAAFYLPGVAPIDYPDGAKVELKVNKLSSVVTQLPYEYYSLPFCKPKQIVSTAENLGEVLTGDRIENSKYEIFMKVKEQCKVLCTRTYDKNEAKAFVKMIEDEYRVNWILDNLPAATPHLLQDKETGEVVKSYELGFPLGMKAYVGAGKSKRKMHFLNNHATVTVYYHSEENEQVPGSRVVGFEVQARSVQHRLTQNAIRPDTCNNIKSAPMMSIDAPTSVTWTYDVIWEPSEIRWAYRWDVYLLMTDGQIHWFSVINSLMIVLFLSGMVAMIMMRTVHQDFARYNQAESSDEAHEEYGWKLVHGDVFRPPAHPLFLSASVGFGVQLLAMSFASMAFALLGFLSPANRGGLLTAVILMFVFMGTFAGYASARNYKMFKGPGWKRCVITTATLYPGVIFIIFFILNFFIWGQKSSGAIPFTTLLALLALWFGISVPLVCLGSYFGFRKDSIENPVRVNQIPRTIPEQVWYMQPTISILLGGILPFGAVFIELYFILSSIWLHHFYYVFGILFIVLCILLITSGEIAIVMCYFQLCSEDYHWWWRSFLTSGASAIYIFLYSVFYFVTKLEIHSFVSALLFFSYTTIICILFFVLTGTIGYFSCLWFVRKIYASVKID
eukprot:TRINITY_DN6881_c0_g2_i1.p1 TRINITY_DN6881_c0_g2~~TRINITY_DN6881_c0_g2_i1.p1  ORF type:complete len:640 (-),score=131.97 TRINITY_DN6881_c0_g2_i1:295-2214(-)